MPESFSKGTQSRIRMRELRILNFGIIYGRLFASGAVAADLVSGFSL